MNRKDGYYLVFLRGCSDYAIFWSNAGELFAPGSTEAQDATVIEYISKEPLDMTRLLECGPMLSMEI